MAMRGRTVKANQPCKFCGSSDAVQMYENGWAHCFSAGCGKNFKWGDNEDEEVYHTKQRHEMSQNKYTIEEIEKLPSRGNKDRLLVRAVAEFYGIKVSVKSDGSIERIFYPLSDDGEHDTGYKMKDPSDKHNQLSIGNVRGPMGINKFSKGGKRIIITEGEEDCWAVQTASFLTWGKFYPVISMGGVQQAKYLLKHREKIRSYDEVILWFDNDEGGKIAVNEAAKIIGYDKVKVVNATEKDANDSLRAGDSDQDMKTRIKYVMNYIYNATTYNPSGIVKGEDTWERYQEYKHLRFVEWPPFMSALNKMTHGRAIGSITMIAAGTGVGKSTFMREDIHHILATTDAKIGVCFLEEDLGETVSAIMSMHLNKRLGLPGTEVTEEEERKAWEETLGTGRVILVDHQGSVSDASLTDKLEFLAVSGCEYIYLDHITIAVSETGDQNMNAAQDAFMNELLRIVKRHPVWLGVVSHLRKVKSGEDSFETGGRIFEDDLKGSGS